MKKTQIVAEINESPCFSVLVDEVTDISVQCQMVTFVQYLNKECQPVIEFSGASNVLENSVSANSETLHIVLKKTLYELDTEKLSGIVTDGARTMVGKKTGLYTKLRS
jgi:hypothetical protein